MSKQGLRVQPFLHCLVHQLETSIAAIRSDNQSNAISITKIVKFLSRMIYGYKTEISEEIILIEIKQKKPVEKSMVPMISEPRDVNA